MVGQPGKSFYSPEDLFTIPNGKYYELEDGRLVMKQGDGLAGIILTRLLCRLHEFVEGKKLGLALNSLASYQCFADRGLVRRPSLSFIPWSRMKEEYWQGHVPVAPDLAGEVVSSLHSYKQARPKIDEYLGAGVRLAWLFNSRENTIEVFRPERCVELLEPNGTLDGEDVVPGFRCPLAEIFQPPPMG
jgi:Uma2 family endonuclease